MKARLEKDYAAITEEYWAKKQAEQEAADAALRGDDELVSPSKDKLKQDSSVVET